MDNHLLLLNGNPKCTLIESFDGKAIVLADGKRLEFNSLKEARSFVEISDLEINCAFLHGSSIKRAGGFQ
jgi:hypothetical protein